MSDNTTESERNLTGLKRAKSLLAETLIGFDNAEKDYGYDMANERYYVREAVNEIEAVANAPEKDELMKMSAKEFIGKYEFPKYIRRAVARIGNTITVAELYADPTNLRHVGEKGAKIIRDKVAELKNN